MPVFEIPITADDPAFKIRTVLEDVQVVLGFTWNERDERWQISVSDPNEAPLPCIVPPFGLQFKKFSRFLPVSSSFESLGVNSFRLSFLLPHYLQKDNLVLFLKLLILP